jgi:hypothetical protein
MSLCLLAAGKTMVIATSAFTLSWTHSVEKVKWRESYAVTEHGLVLGEAAVKGSGAGMEPGEGAVLNDGWWVWHPPAKPLTRLALAASGATGSGWRLCHLGGCVELGALSGDETVLSRCDGDGSNGR